MRPSLLRNNGDGTFTDVASEVGVAYSDRGQLLCPDCDAPLWLQFRPCLTNRLAQRALLYGVTSP